MKKQIVSGAKKLLSDAKIYWKNPPSGSYINYRSIFAYSFGGIGVYAVVFLYNTINVTATNVIISNAAGIPPSDLLVMYYITFFISVFFTGIRAKIIDSARNKKGKYRPYILTMGLPSALLLTAIVWFPYSSLKTYAMKWAVVFLLNLALQFFYGFFFDAYDNLILVMSPNSQERANITSIKSIVYSFAPTVLNPLIPLLVKWLNASDMYDIKIYKAMFPPVAIISIAFIVIVFAYTEEKIVQAKTHIVQIRFIDALRAVAKNKYFWIISLAGWIGFLESMQSNILNWLYTYAGMCTDGQYSFITLVYGNASLWGMLAAPFAIKKYGKKKVLIVTNAFNITFIALMYPAIKEAYSIWLVLICLYMNAAVSSFAHILTPSINADIRDYQQYITGERIDGMFSAIGLIGAFIGLITEKTVTPMLYDKFGINNHNGYENAFDILKYNHNTLFSLIYLMIFLSVIGAALNVIPYFFYDLSEIKQKGMIKILKIRAMFEDFGNGALSDADAVEGIDIIKQSREYAVKEQTTVNKALKTDLKLNQGLKGFALRKKINSIKENNSEIEVSKIVLTELNKFSDKSVQAQLEAARKTAAKGLDGIYFVERTVLTQARSLPKKTPLEKKLRAQAIETAKTQLIGKKCALKHFPDGMPQENYAAELRNLFEKEDAIDEKLRLLYRKRFDAKKKKEYSELTDINTQLKLCRSEKTAVEKNIKKISALNTFYNRAGKAFFDAEKLIAQEKNYDGLEEIEALYSEAKTRYEQYLREKKNEDAELEEKRKAEKEALKAEKKQKSKKSR